MKMISYFRFGISAIILVFSLTLSGCPFFSDSSQVDSGTDKLILKIKKGEEKSTEMVRNILATVKDRVKIQKARNLYVEAEAQNNSCITLLTVGIIEAHDISKNFKACTKTADMDLSSFLKYGMTITSTFQPKAPFSVLPLGEVIGSLFKGGIAIWQAHKDEDRKSRMFLASFLSKELTWPAWEQIK